MKEIIWRAIHLIEYATAKDDLSNLTHEQLEQLVLDVYGILKEVELTPTKRPNIYLKPITK